MSPELELLDQLCGGDLKLNIVLQVFGDPADPASVVRARRAVVNQEREGLVQVVQRDKTKEFLLEEWEVPRVLNDDSNWYDEAGTYFLRITQKGGAIIA